jgi:hypothetical protein
MPPVESPRSNEPGLRGEVVYLFAFDVANEVRLDRAAELVPAKSAPAATGEHPAPREVPVTRSVVVEFDPPSARLKGAPIHLFIRIYEVGVISVMVRVPFAADSLEALARFHAPVLDDGRPLEELARAECAALRGRIADALVRHGPDSEPEAYTVFCLTALDGERDANRWLFAHERSAAGLLATLPGERLSEAQVAEILRLRRSFEKTDLVVIDWDAALIVELDGSVEDVLRVLEVANLQLEEFRWMDRTLDRYLERAYEDLNRRRWWWFGRGAAVLRSLRQLRVDLTKLADEVTHATKFVGDWHLARVYQLARERFHLDQWRASVDQRLGELDRLYTLTRGDLNDRRMLWLEFIIVVFFALDLIILLVK